MSTVTRHVLRRSIGPIVLCACLLPAQTTKLPVGMNIQGLTYYSPGIFTDVMTASSEWITYDDGGAWDSQKQGKLQLDSNDYPVEIPQTIDGRATRVRCMLNNFYTGRYRFLWDGDGEIEFSVDHEAAGGKHFVSFDGKGGHKWIHIARSTKGNHVRNIRIIPDSLADSYDPSNPRHLFHPLVLKGLEPFHAIRFMDWSLTNGSNQRYWRERPKPADRSQAPKGVCIEHAIALCNHLNADPWFCMPHAADDDYILQFARLVKNTLKPGRKVYVEYSNEIWNWGFQQAHYVGRNGRMTDHPAWNADDTVYNALRAVGQKYCGNPDDYCHPEKDAYMMMRTFKLWRSVYSGADTSRIVRVAAVQHAWYDNDGRILSFLFEPGNGGCDAMSPGGYFSFEQANHNVWNAMQPSQVKPEMIIRAVDSLYDSTSGTWTRQGAKHANKYKVDYLVYEGGQHMQPYNQGEWGYNKAVWDAQVHPAMYDLYMKNFRCHAEPGVNCKLFMAFSYVGPRESRWGSWGHLEAYDQLNSMATLKTVAPKYQALLDANSPKAPAGAIHAFPSGSAARPAPITLRPTSTRAGISVATDHLRAPAFASVTDHRGRCVARGPVSAGGRLPGTDRLGAGVYLVKLHTGETVLKGTALVGGR